MLQNMSVVYEQIVSSAMVSSENQERDQLSDSTTTMVVLVIQTYNTCWRYVQLPDFYDEPIILSDSSSLDALKRISLPASDYQDSGERLQREIMTAMGVPEHVQAEIVSRVESEFKRLLETSNSGSSILLKVDISRIHWHECDYNDPRIRQALLRLGIPLPPTPKPKYDISVLPRLVLLAGINEEPENCSVCLEKFKERDELIMLPCCHLFHYDCIDKWLDFSHSCPLCRHELL